jgi:medium-chain acyl-[acyl-carrier-protein] hydrolase
MSPPVAERWLVCFKPQIGKGGDAGVPRAPWQARARLFCFPYAGGGASGYRGWADALPAGIEVGAIQLPGREDRIRQEPFTDLNRLLDALVEALQPHLDRPFAFFGHSMGSLIAFELTRRLRRLGGPLPVHLFVSGRPAPQLPLPEQQLHTLPDADLRKALVELGGTSAQVLAHDELMSLLMPMIRADLTLCETYVYQPEEPLPCPLTIFGGLLDQRTQQQELEAWREQTRGRFHLQVFPGNHFFLNPFQREVCQQIAQDLDWSLEASLRHESPLLPPGEVHLYRANLAQEAGNWQRWWPTLNAEEQQRAVHFAFASDRQHFVVCRGILRAILARYLSLPPQEVRFTAGPHGKPALDPAQGQAGLRFNLTHSEGLALYAMAWNREVGIDLERIRDQVEHQEIARRFFSPREARALEQLSGTERLKGFYRCWTRKEAVLKASGHGLLFPLDQVEVLGLPDHPGGLLTLRDQPGLPGTWTLRDLDVEPEYLAALVVEGDAWILKSCRWCMEEGSRSS